MGDERSKAASEASRTDRPPYLTLPSTKHQATSTKHQAPSCVATTTTTMPDMLETMAVSAESVMVLLLICFAGSMATKTGLINAEQRTGLAKVSEG